MIKNNNIGIDIVDIARFHKLKSAKTNNFIQKVFCRNEIKYCLSYNEPAVHFAGIFAAKEAVSKALGTEKFPFIELEIRHTKSGMPEAWNKGKKLPVKISITHTQSIAAAVALS